MEVAAKELIDGERRATFSDRRNNYRRAALHSIYKKRRSSHRRATDRRDSIYVDKHDPYVVVLALSIMLLCIFDAFFTLRLLSHGSEELNPVLAVLIEIDISLFLLIKFFVTGAAVSFLVMHKYYRIMKVISGYHLLIFCTIVYLALVTYELSMLRHISIL